MGGGNERSNEKTQNIVFWVVWKIVSIRTILWLRHGMIKSLVQKHQREQRKENDWKGECMMGEHLGSGMEGTSLMPIPQLNQSQESQSWKPAKCYSPRSTNRLQNKESSPALQGRKRSLKETVTAPSWKSYSGGNGFPTPILWSFLREYQRQFRSCFLDSPLLQKWLMAQLSNTVQLGVIQIFSYLLVYSFIAFIFTSKNYKRTFLNFI